MAASTQPTAPILDFSAVIRRERVKMPDGKTYEMKSPDELPWMAYRGSANQFVRFGQLLATPVRSAEEEKEVEALSRKLVRDIILEAPDKVLDLLTPDQRLAVVTVFSFLLLKTKAAGQKGRAAARQIATILTTGNTSRASSPRSTKGPLRRTGSMRRRSVS